MKKIMTLLLCLSLFQISSNAQFGKLKNAAKKAESKLKSAGGDLTSELSTDEIGKGLKEALNVGVGKYSGFLFVQLLLFQFWMPISACIFRSH